MIFETVQRTHCQHQSVTLTLRAFTATFFCCLLLGCQDSGIDQRLVDLNDLGVAQMGQFKYADAHQTFESVLNERSDLQEVRVNLAIATLNKQDPGGEQKTLDILNTVLQVNPTHIRALYTTGIVHLYLGNPSTTIEFLSKVVELDPSDAYATYFLAQAYLQTEEYEKAKQWFLKSIELDEYLRSAYWAASTAARRLQDAELANELVDTYQKYESNPLSKTAGISYKQMGPKAEVTVLSQSLDSETVQQISGPLFTEPQLLLDSSHDIGSLSVADIDGDRDWEILFDQEGCVAFIEPMTDDQSEVSTINSLFCLNESEQWAGGPTDFYWGDLNNDSLVDTITCSNNGIHVAYQNLDAAYEIHLITDKLCQHGVLYDADHDGDLDFLARSDSHLELWNNNLDGSFTDISDQTGFNNATDLSDFVVGDFDSDRDLDVVTLEQNGKMSLWINNRTWSYEPVEISLQTATQAIPSVADMNGDGLPELILARANVLTSLQYDVASKTLVPLAEFEHNLPQVIGTVIEDFNGDGYLDVLIYADREIAIYSPMDGTEIESLATHGATFVETVYLPETAGFSLLVRSENGLELYRPGTSRGNYVSMVVSGKSDSDQLRSNTSGIGTSIRARVEDHWVVLNTLGRRSTNGQSLHPQVIGVGDNEQVNFLELVWSDGVTQSELALAHNQLHEITETQRQLASCPVVFVWNGSKYEFVSDVLGVAALGFFHTPDQNAPYRSYERLLLKPELLVAKDGFYEVKIGEPMEEILYLDAAYIDVYDVPSSHSLVIDERYAVNTDQPSGRPIVYSENALPIKAILNKSTDVTSEILQVDRRAPPLKNKDPNFIGLLREPTVLELEFEHPLKPKGAVLLVEGWVEFPYSQTVFAASQSGKTYSPPTLEIGFEDGRWETLIESFGYPAGMPKQMTLPLNDLPEGVIRLRLSTNMEVYWDLVQVVYENPSAEISHQRIEPSHGKVLRSGFAERSTYSQRVPYYDYDNRSPYWDAKYAKGLYSRTGDVLELIQATDSAVAVIGSGEEIHLQFSASLDEPVEGFNRYYVLDFRGWAKDMDLYTEDGEIVEPLPNLSSLSDAESKRRDQLHAKYNTRFESGLATY